MAHNGGNGPPPPPRLGPTVHTAPLLPRNANIHSNVFPPQLSFTSTTLLPPSSPHRLARSPPSSSLPANTRVITLEQPQPPLARVSNEYIDTPLRPPLPSSPAATLHRFHHNHYHKKGTSSTASSVKLDQLSVEESSRTGAAASATTSLAEVHSTLNNNRDSYHLHHRPLNHFLLQPGPVNHDGRPQTLQSPSTQRLHHNTQLAKPIVTQPCSTLKSLSTTKRDVTECRDDVTFNDSTKEDAHGESIICPKCNRCRCGACRSNRPLPSTWIYSYQCSAETVLDYCTCMCCVKAAFYHCCKDYEMDSREVSCADKPCSCSPHHRWLRWGCLCVLTAVLPCLLCYLPMKACAKLCEACHGRFTNHGCRCSPSTPNTTSTNTSRFTSPVGSDNDDDITAFRRKDLDTTTTPLKNHSKKLLDPSV